MSDLKRFRYLPRLLGTESPLFTRRPRQRAWAGMTRFRQLDSALKYANTVSSGEARRIRESALRSMVERFNKRKQYLYPLPQNRVKLDPGYFTALEARRNWKGCASGWSDIPERPPTIRFNNSAFKSALLLSTVFGHETAHFRQFHLPQIFRGECIYEVQPGDNLSRISRKLTPPGERWYDWRDLYNLNRHIIGENPNVIRPGWRLKVPFKWGVKDDGWTFREFHAGLTDLKGVYRSGPMSAYNQLNTILKGNGYLQQLERGDPHWLRLSTNPGTQMIPRLLKHQWNTAREKVWREIRWDQIPGALDLPQFKRFWQPSPKPWQQLPGLA